MTRNNFQISLSTPYHFWSIYENIDSSNNYSFVICKFNIQQIVI